MQVFAYMQPKRVPSPSATRQRVLEAAARVYGRDGLSGATTRAIANEAGVNEVTLFRHFQSKERLLAAVVGQAFGAQPAVESAPLPTFTDDLRSDLLQLASRYEAILTDNLPLVRTMVGEIHHHGREQEKQVFKGVFRPLKEAIAARLEDARATGKIRNDIPVAVLADLLGGMLFTGVLRRSSKDMKTEYSADTYRESAVDLVLRGTTPEVRRMKS